MVEKNTFVKLLNRLEVLQALLLFHHVAVAVAVVVVVVVVVVL